MIELKRDQHWNGQPDHAQRGSNLVEMALILPLLALLLFGVVDIGRAFYTHITITNASREGARRASRLPDQDAAIKQAVRQEAANNNIDLGEDTATITIGRIGEASDWHGGDPITVTVEYTFTTFIGGLIGLPEFPMLSNTEMVIFGYTD